MMTTTEGLSPRTGDRSARGLRSWLRVVGAIALKDIADSIRNRTILALVIGVGLMLLSGMALPALLQLNSKPLAFVYDPDKSRLLRSLTARDEFKLALVDSPAEVAESLTSMPRAAIGLILPPGSQGSQASGPAGMVIVQGYYPHWMDPAEVAEQAAFFEAQLSEAGWQSVRIVTDEHAVYPAVEWGGHPLLFSVTAGLILLIVGLAIVPHLMIEEKEAHTFEALLVSPARMSQVVLGKALAGMVYSLAAAAVVLGLNTWLIVHWEIALLAALLGAAFGVGAGLLIGALVDNPATLSLWVGALLIPLLVPSFLGFFENPPVPEVVRVAISYLPSVALMKLVKIAMAGDLTGAPILFNAAVLLGATALLLALTVWWVRRMEA
jgi:hypothetical protein